MTRQQSVENQPLVNFQRYEEEFANVLRVNGMIVLPYTQEDNPLTVEYDKGIE